MYYKNVETYLNEEVRRPIKYYLRGVDKKTAGKIMDVVDYLCDKYREANGTGLWYEKKAKFEPGDLRNYIRFMTKHGYLKPVDYDKLESPFTEEEMIFLFNENFGEDE